MTSTGSQTPPRADRLWLPPCHERPGGLGGWRRPRREEADTTDADRELEPVLALRPLETSPGCDRRDAGRDRARRVRPAGSMGGTGGEPGRRAGRAAGHALVLG